MIVTHNAALAGTMERVITLRDGKVERDERKSDAAFREQAPEAAASERAGTGKVDVG